jgi:hypothetical protein
MHGPKPQDDEARRREREARVSAIRDGARVRRALGEAAGYQRDGDEHIVTWRGRRVRGATVDAAVAAARIAELSRAVAHG